MKHFYARPKNHQIQVEFAGTLAIAMNHAADRKEREKSNPQKGTARDGNGSGSGRVEQLPARQQRGCG
jgi:hypothetical protein